VRVFRGGKVVATHARSKEPHSKVVDPSHYDGLWRKKNNDDEEPSEGRGTLGELGRSLSEYAALVDSEAS
jgi:hypothetical protein